jgi:(1->4)-alpha-D-glucan 1-alpha-D-glucosylmutase
VAAEWRDAGVKLLVLWRVLAFRRERPELFARGSYQPLPAEGGKAEHVMAFARTLDADSCVTVAPRLWPALCPEDQTKPDWDDTALALPDGRFHDVFTGGIVEGRVPLAALLADFPVAFLVRC